MGFADQIYRKLPTLAQHAAVTAFGLRWKWRRFGGNYAHERDAFIARERNTLEEWRAWQTHALRDILRLAARTRHYRHLLADRAIDRFELSDLASLPILEKSDTRADPDAFLVEGLDPRKLTICATSGSSIISPSCSNECV
jgi:phenylacetate-coenzyme A ligase PaaK-like adenylate-forming protein